MTDETKNRRRDKADTGNETDFRPLTDEERALIEDLGLDPEYTCIAGGLVLDLSC